MHAAGALDDDGHQEPASVDGQRRVVAVGEAEGVAVVGGRQRAREGVGPGHGDGAGEGGAGREQGEQQEREEGSHAHQDAQRARRRPVRRDFLTRPLQCAQGRDGGRAARCGDPARRRLAAAAEVGAALADDDALDLAPAARARLAGAAVDGEALLRRAVAAVGRAVVADGGSLRLDALAQHLADRLVQPFQPRAAHAPGGRAGMDAGAPERLVDVDVPEPGHGALVEQRGLHGRLAAAQPLRQVARGEGVAERLGAEAGVEVRLGVERIGQQVPGAEAADVGVDERRAVVEQKLGAAERAADLPRARRPPERVAGHAQVHHQGGAAGEPHQQVLPAPVEPLDGLAEQPLGGQRGRLRRRQARVQHLGGDDPAPLDEGRETPPNGLDLGQLGHARSLDSARRRCSRRSDRFLEGDDECERAQVGQLRRRRVGRAARRGHAHRAQPGDRRGHRRGARRANEADVDRAVRAAERAFAEVVRDHARPALAQAVPDRRRDRREPRRARRARVAERRQAGRATPPARWPSRRRQPALLRRRRARARGPGRGRVRAQATPR